MAPKISKISGLNGHFGPSFAKELRLPKAKQKQKGVKEDIIRLIEDSRRNAQDGNLKNFMKAKLKRGREDFGTLEYGECTQQQNLKGCF